MVPISQVKLNDPIVEISDLLEPVSVTRGWRPSVREPTQFWWVEDGGNHKLVTLAGVELVLVVNGLPEEEDVVGNAGEVATPEQVIDPSNQQNSHWSLVLAVVHHISMVQVGNSPARDGVPVNMDWVWGADNTWLPRREKLVELAVSKTHIQAKVRADRVVHLASRAQVDPVPVRPLNSLCGTDLYRGVVKVVDREGCQGLWLPVTADVTHWRCHAARWKGQGQSTAIIRRIRHLATQ